MSDQGEAHQVRWKYALVDLGRHYPSNRPSTLTSPRIRRTRVTLYQRPWAVLAKEDSWRTPSWLSEEDSRMDNVVDLTSNHEEADTRMLFHAKYVASPIIWNRRSSFECSPLCEHYTGVKDQMRFVPIHDVCQKLGDSVLAALPVFHALTGCDNNISISVWVMNSPFLR